MGDPEMEGTARREMVTAPLPPPEEGRVENPLFRFVFVPLLAQQPAVPTTSIKEQFPQSLGLKRRRVVYRASRDHFPPPLSPGSGGLPKSISGLSVQGPALRAVPVASHLHQSRGGGPCPPERTGCAHSQLPRRLARTCTVSQAVVRTQGPGAQAPQPAGPSGQLRKEQTRANAEDLISRHGVRFGQPNSTPHPGTCSVGAELLQDLIRQDGGSTETLSEAPWAYGCSCGDSPARSAPYETASALALWLNPEVGVETRHSPGSDYTGLPQDLQAVVRSLVPSDRSAPGAGIQTCYGIHDASATGWGATYKGHAVSGVWTGPNCTGISIASSCWQYALP